MPDLCPELFARDSSPSESQELRAHIAECPACRFLIDVARETSGRGVEYGADVPSSREVETAECDEFAPLIAALSVTTLDAADQAALENHLTTCTRCLAVMASVVLGRDDWAALSRPRDENRPAIASPVSFVHEPTQQAETTMHPVNQNVISLQARRRRTTYVLAAVVAAAAAAAVLFLTLSDRSGSPDGAPIEASHESSASANQELIGGAAQRPAPPPAKTAQKPAPEKSTEPNADDREQTAENQPPRTGPEEEASEGDEPTAEKEEKAKRTKKARKRRFEDKKDSGGIDSLSVEELDALMKDSVSKNYYAAALRYCEKAMKLDRANKKRRIMCGFMACRIKKLDKARKWYSRVDETGKQTILKACLSSGIDPRRESDK